MDNLKQVSDWTLKGFQERKEHITLFLKLTRKDVKQLTRFPLTAAFEPKFQKFCKVYDKLETEYQKGITDHRVWAGELKSAAAELSKHATLA